MLWGRVLACRFGKSTDQVSGAVMASRDVSASCASPTVQAESVRDHIARGAKVVVRVCGYPQPNFYFLYELISWHDEPEDL